VATPVNWLDRFNGSFKDEPEFDKVIEYGRAGDAGCRATTGGHRIVKYLLDTDHISIWQRQSGAESHDERATTSAGHAERTGSDGLPGQALHASAVVASDQ
jgi:hypothetical protein